MAKQKKVESHIVGEFGMERDVLGVRKINEWDMENFGTLDKSEKTIAILGDKTDGGHRWLNRKGTRHAIFVMESMEKT